MLEKSRDDKMSKERKYSKTGMGETYETPTPKRAGKTPMTEVEKDKKYEIYCKKMDSRGLKDKTLEREKWNKSMPSGETSSELFVRLTKSRMPKVIKSIEGLKNLTHYEHTDTQKDKILTDLKNAVNFVETSFSAKSEKKEVEEYQI